MFENLKLEAPHIYQLIKSVLIGGGGVPDEMGDAIGGFVRAAEVQYNGAKGSYWFRVMRPGDNFVGGTDQTYSATYTTVTRKGIVGTTVTTLNTVPTREAIVCVGWYCPVDLGAAGYLSIEKFGVIKSNFPARIIYRQQNPDHFLFDLDTVIHGSENETFAFVVYNGLGSDRAGQIYPILFRIAPRAALNLEKRV